MHVAFSFTSLSPQIATEWDPLTSTTCTVYAIMKNLALVHWVKDQVGVCRVKSRPIKNGRSSLFLVAKIEPSPYLGLGLRLHVGPLFTSVQFFF